MSSILSSAEQETLVSSFLEIAVGRSIETARHFLRAAKWRIEDALQLYYVGDAEQSDASSSYFLPAEFTPLLSDHNHSTLEDSICNQNDGHSHAGDRRCPLPLNKVAPTTSLCRFDHMTPASPPTAACRKRRPHTKEPIPPQVSRIPPSNDVVGTSRHTRNRSTGSPHSRQSMRLKALQQNCPLEEPSLPQPTPIIPSADVAGTSRCSGTQSADITYSRKSKRLAAIQEGCSLKFTWQPFVMGSCILALPLVMKHLGKRRKNLRFLQAAGPLTTIVLGTLIVKIFHPSSISVVGEIPQGLPTFSVPQDFAYFKSLIPIAFLITGVAILESVGIAKALAAKNGYELDANRELFGLGVANIMGSFFSAYLATSSFSRSAVNNESGAKTGFAGIIIGMLIGCGLLLLTSLFEDKHQMQGSSHLLRLPILPNLFYSSVMSDYTNLAVHLYEGQDHDAKSHYINESYVQ